MATIRNIPRGTRMPSLRNAVMVDTCQGVLRVRKWPKKRGTPKSALQRWWMDWFKEANLLAKYADGMTQARAIALTKHSGLYPRDIMLRAMRGRLYWWSDQDGNRWYPMAGIQDISDTLDILAQKVGSVLVRAADRWRAAGPDFPAVGQVLTYQGSATPPIWAAAGAGIVQEVIAGTPIVPDGTANAYEIDVTSYAQVEILLDNVGYAASTQAGIVVSTDGGATYKTAGTDYRYTYLRQAAEAAGDAGLFGAGATNAAGGHDGVIKFSGLSAGRVSCTSDTSAGAGAVARRSGYANFDGPITNIKIYSISAANFNAGVLRFLGIRG